MSAVDNQIRTLLRKVDQLERSIDTARREYEGAANRKRQYERRISEVRHVKSMLSSSFDWSVDAIRNRQSAVKGKLESATSGLSHEGMLTSAVARDLERSTESDSYGSQMHDLLQREINRCQSEINSAQSAMSSSSSRANGACATRSSLVRQARELSRRPDAMVSVRESTRY